MLPRTKNGYKVTVHGDCVTSPILNPHIKQVLSELSCIPSRSLLSSPVMIVLCVGWTGVYEYEIDYTVRHEMCLKGFDGIKYASHW